VCLGRSLSPSSSQGSKGLFIGSGEAKEGSRAPDKFCEQGGRQPNLSNNPTGYGGPKVSLARYKKWGGGGYLNKLP